MSLSLYACFESGRIIPTDADLNMSNSNAREFVAVLGLELDDYYCLSTDIDEFLRAIELFQTSELAAIVDNGTATRQDGIMIHCGRRAGYFQERIQVAKELLLEGRGKGAALARMV